MLLKRYSNIDYILKLPLKRATKLIKKAQEEETREYAFRIYLAAYPNMDKKNFKSFDNFWEEIKPKRIKLDNRSEEEIMNEILDIEKSFKKGDGK